MYENMSALTSNICFFMLFQTQCSVYKKKAALYQLKNDVHSYPKYRLIFFVILDTRYLLFRRFSSFSNARLERL